MKTVGKYISKVASWVIDTYFRLRNYVVWGEYDKKHIIFQKDGNQIKISIKSHGVFVDEKQKKIDEFKKKENEARYIEFALEQAIDGCNFINFSKGKMYVQFWTTKGNLDFTFPIGKVGENGRYYYQVIGLLADMDFVRDSFVPTQLPTFFGTQPNHTYKVEVGRDLKIINGYCEKRVWQATELTMRMFKEIYKAKKGGLKIEVG